MLEGAIKARAKKVAADSNASYREWVDQALDKGAGPAHAWTRHIERAPPLPECIIDEGKGNRILTDPVDKTHYYVRYWSEYWQREWRSYGQVLRDLVAVRFRAADIDMPPIEPSEVRAAAKAIKLDTGLGIDLA